ncbi:hypothetical protein [Streptomyces sp. NPDC088760]|uniref:hypothetical protein n=1 Tax=Streptomyces sp. NPDC088760 TaxID=3365890 RepID=UPI00382C1C85
MRLPHLLVWTLVAQRMELSEREIAGPIDVWGTDRAEDAAECAFLGRGKENADRSLPMTKEQVFEDLFEAEGSPYWRLKQEQLAVGHRRSEGPRAGRPPGGRSRRPPW